MLVSALPRTKHMFASLLSQAGIHPKSSCAQPSSESPFWLSPVNRLLVPASCKIHFSDLILWRLYNLAHHFCSSILRTLPIHRG
ncbi:hypothetical protein BDU57DRAFT_510219 [Ampelomyces quisqualis]|uniref:Uncharacterized protein n=1 Tax=Ampelomyces quisqualis TaxID=50730 RepID=A0A6A5R671_AMPQU|nr:hypothetical protein BDU57DRAFT_510219 [Ampelomyces quisqualis]